MYAQKNPAEKNYFTIVLFVLDVIFSTELLNQYSKSQLALYSEGHLRFSDFSAGVEKSECCSKRKGSSHLSYDVFFKTYINKEYQFLRTVFDHGDKLACLQLDITNDNVQFFHWVQNTSTNRKCLVTAGSLAFTGK